MGRHVRRALAISLLAAVAACGAEPEYRGLNLIAYNYTPWDIDTIIISDKAGRTAGSGAMGVGGGEGSVTCCHTLKGTEFKVQWSGLSSIRYRVHAVLVTLATTRRTSALLR